MFTPKRDTMHLRNKPFVWVGFFLVLAAASLSWAQGQQGSQGQQQIQPTPLPSDVDPGDPALPTWMRPAAPPPGPKNTTPSNQKPVQHQGQVQSGRLTTG